MEEKLEFLLGLSTEKLAKLENALENNWIVQLALAVGGLALIFDIGDFPRLAAKYLGQEKYSLKPVAAVAPALLLYFFMKFGHLLTAFLEARELHDHLLLRFIGSDFEGRSLSALRETTSFFEGYYSAKLFGGQGPLIFVYYAFSSVTMSIGQAAVLFLIVQAYGLTLWSSVAVAGCGIAILLLYREFWRAKKQHPQTTRMVVGCLVLLVSWLVLFALQVPIP
jgi:hypothetical protein